MSFLFQPCTTYPPPSLFGFTSIEITSATRPKPSTPRKILNGYHVDDARSAVLVQAKIASTACFPRAYLRELRLGSIRFGVDGAPRRALSWC